MDNDNSVENSVKGEWFVKILHRCRELRHGECATVGLVRVVTWPYHDEPHPVTRGDVAQLIWEVTDTSDHWKTHETIDPDSWHFHIIRLSEEAGRTKVGDLLLFHDGIIAEVGASGFNYLNGFYCSPCWSVF